MMLRKNNVKGVQTQTPRLSPPHMLREGVKGLRGVKRKGGRDHCFFCRGWAGDIITIVVGVRGKHNVKRWKAGDTQAPGMGGGG